MLNSEIDCRRFRLRYRRSRFHFRVHQDRFAQWRKTGEARKMTNQVTRFRMPLNVSGERFLNSTDKKKFRVFVNGLTERNCAGQNFLVEINVYGCQHWSLKFRTIEKVNCYVLCVCVYDLERDFYIVMHGSDWKDVQCVNGSHAEESRRTARLVVDAELADAHDVRGN